MGDQVDRELELVLHVYRLAESVPLDTALMVLMTTVSLLIKGSGLAGSLWQQLAERVEEQRLLTQEGTATHPPPQRMQ